MIEAIIDTDILSRYLRGNNVVKERFDNYLECYYSLNISVLTYYEIISGLKHRDARKQLDFFLNFCEYATIIPITEGSARRSAEIYASLRGRGEIIDDVDILIAGICLEEGYALVTNNTKHFSRIEELKILNWCE